MNKTYGFNEVQRDSEIAELSIEVHMHVEILIEYFSLSAFSNGKQVSLPMIMKSDINSVSKL